MNAQGIGQLGIGLLGVWAFIQALLVFPRVAATATFLSAQHGAYAALIAMALPFVLLLGLSYVLVFHAAGVARRVLSPLELEQAGPPADLGRVLVGLVGVFIFTGSLPSLVQVWVLAPDMAAPLRLQVWVASLAQATVGLVMVLWPVTLVNLWKSRGPAAPSGRAT
jgi:hypothetical protein